MDHRGGENKGGRKRNLNSGRPQEPREGSRKRNLNSRRPQEPREGYITERLNPRRPQEPREGSITQHSNVESPQKLKGKERSGQTLLNEKRYREALEFYDRRLLDKPLNANLHVGKGEALLGSGRSKEALEAYKEAIRLAPDLSSAYRGQSKVYEQLAQQSYEKARELGVE